MALRFRILAGVEGGPAPQGPATEPVAPAEERALEILEDLDEIRLGRQPGLEIELPFGAVSTVHARITRGQTPGDWWLEDLGSMNGTWLQGARLAPRRPAPLRAGQRLRLATVELVFDGWSATARGTEGTASLARRLIGDLFGTAGADTPVLLAEGGAAHPQRLALAERDRPYLVGRGETCDVVLTGEAISREHAAFTRRWDGVTVGDRGSRNGVRVNGDHIDGEHPLADGDRIDIGAVTFCLTDPESRYLRRLRGLAEVPSVPRRPTPAIPGRAAADPPGRDTVGRRMLIASVAFVAVAALAALVALLVGL